MCWIGSATVSQCGTSNQWRLFGYRLLVLLIESLLRFAPVPLCKRRMDFPGSRARLVRREARRTIMQRPHFGPSRWSLIAPVPANPSSFRRWNLFIISILALLVLAVYIAAVGSGLGDNASATTGTSGFAQSPKQMATQRATRHGG
jgi:hypothetical protein